MEDLNDKTLGSNLAAEEWNQVPSELQNIIEQTGQALTNGDLDQLGKGVASYVANGNFYEDNGVADSYVLASIGSKQSLVNYVDGMTVEFLAGNSNTGATIVNVTSLGAKDIVDSAGGALVGGEIVAGKRITLKYRAGGDNNFIIDSNRASVLTGSIAAWPVAAVPGGYFECNGDSVNRADFNDLFLVLGVTYGNVDGNTFNLPDLRGEFIRGFDNGEGNDPDAGSRTSRGDGTTGDNVGTKQLDAFDMHFHTYGGLNQVAATGIGGVRDAQFNGDNDTSSVGGSETRPRNVYMMYIIKF